MHEYSRPLGDAVKRARGKLDLTQNEVADIADIDVRTVLNIENYKGNPKMEVLYPLVRALKIDAREIFNPEMQRETPALRQLRLLIEDCSEEEAAAIIPVFKAVLTALRDKNATSIKCNRASFPVLHKGKLALRSGRPAHLLITIFNFTTSIRTSFLHFGQYSGNWISTVSSYTFVLVFPPQIGQCTHKEPS